ncbi:Hypothetical protein PBC10988_37930 [Planctomycetales bacterium 10988]|nr:Hypothetical protein PBC10988_37930 [Planctomycetales bacterium 10988]
MGSFVAGISVFCFAASYTVSFLLEWTRPLFRSGVRGFLMLGFAAAGLIAHTLFLWHRSLSEITQHAVPLSSSYDWYLMAAWVLATCYLYLTICYPRTSIGIFMLPLVLALIGVATFFADSIPFTEKQTLLIWGWLHGMCHMLGSVAVMLGFVSGAMYLLQARRLKQSRLPSQGMKLPSLESLERMASQAIRWSVLFVGLGLLTGLALNVVSAMVNEESNPQIAWTDPLVWVSCLLFGWILIVAIFGQVYQPTRQGKKIAYLTMATFLFLVLQLSFTLWYPTDHRNSSTHATLPENLQKLLPETQNYDRIVKMRSDFVDNKHI